MKPLFERYRPKTWSEVIGQDRCVNRLLAIRQTSGFGGRAYWISGQSGTGKTTIAKLLKIRHVDRWHAAQWLKGVRRNSRLGRLDYRLTRAKTYALNPDWIALSFPQNHKQKAKSCA